MIEPSEGSRTSLSAQAGRDFFWHRLPQGGVRESSMHVCLLLQMCFQNTAWPTLLGSGKHDPHAQRGRAPPARLCLAVQGPVVGQEHHDADYYVVPMKK
jgi:hypothetical protein